MSGAFTLTGKLLRHDKVTPIVDSPVTLWASPYPDPTDLALYTQGASAVTGTTGAFSVSLVVETGLYYTVASSASPPVFDAVTFAVPAVGATIDLSSLISFNPASVTPSVLTQALAARDDAAASAATATAAANAMVSSWQASTSYAAGAVRIAPDGTTISRNAAGTSRASYDATEQALWTPVVAVAGTGVKVALDAAYGAWQAATVYAAGAVRFAPDGTPLNRIAAGTSRATFDATEQAAWTVVETAAGSLASAALDARYAQLARTYDIRDYQAVSGGPDIATATNNAITAANAAGGGTVLVPASASVWFFGSTLNLKANVSLLIMGTLRALSTHTGAGVTVSDASNTTIYGVGTIDMNKAATTNGGVASAQQGIYVVAPTATSAVTRTTIRDVVVVNCWQRAIHTQGGLVAGATITDLTIDHVTISNCGGNGIYVQGIGNTDHTTPSTSRRIAVTNCTLTGVGIVGILFVGVSDINCDRNKLDGVGATSHGICFGSSTTTALCTDFSATANVVRNFVTGSAWGICVSTNATRFAVTNNIVTGCTGGITCDPEDAAAVAVLVDVQGSITGNTVVGSTASNGINARISKYLRITGNHSSGNFLAGIQVSNALGCVVANNTITGNGSHGIALAGGNAGTGDHRLGVNYSFGNNTRNVSGRNFFTDGAAPIASTIASTVTFATSTP